MMFYATFAVVTLLLAQSAFSQSACTVSLKKPPPRNAVCGHHGFIKEPHHLVNGSVGATSVSSCRESCAQFQGCKSFVYSNKTASCQILSEPVHKQDFKHRRHHPAVVYDLRCFTECPPPSPKPTPTNPNSVPSDTSTSVPTFSAGPVPYPEAATVQNIQPGATADLIYGTVDASDIVIYGIITLQAPAETQLVNIASFTPFINNTDCSPASITLTFSGEDAFNVASSTWPEQFVLVTATQAYCGSSNDTETFYDVVNPIFDSENNAVTLPVQEIGFKDATNGYSLEFGSHNETDSTDDRKIFSRSTGTPSPRDPRVPSIAAAIRNHFRARHGKRSQGYNEDYSNTFRQPLSPGLWNNVGITTFGGGPLLLECQGSSAGCGLTADVNVYGRVTLQGNPCVSGCEQYYFSVDVINPHIDAQYLASVGYGYAYDYSLDRDLEKVTFNTVTMGNYGNLTMTAILHESFNVKGSGEFELGNVGYLTAGTYSTYNVDFDSSSISGYNPPQIYMGSIEDQSGYRPDWVSLKHNVGPEVGITFDTPTGPYDAPAANEYLGIWLADAGLEWDLVAVSNYTTIYGQPCESSYPYFEAYVATISRTPLFYSTGYSASSGSGTGSSFADSGEQLTDPTTRKPIPNSPLQYQCVYI